MKRIVECPSCKTKMQIFDLGKILKQKCPRCKNDFEITPEKSADDSTPAADAEKKEITLKAPIKDAAKTEDQKMDKNKDEATDNANATDKDEKVAEVKSSDEPALKNKKQLSFKKTNSNSATPAAPSVPTTEPPIAGLSGLQFMIILVLLIVVLALQVINMKKNSTLADNQQMIYKQLSIK